LTLNVENNAPTIKRRFPNELNLQQYLCEKFKPRINKKRKQDVNMNVRIYLRSRRFPWAHWTGDRVSLILGQKVAKTIAPALPRNEP
jgi:hypothetical protein